MDDISAKFYKELNEMLPLCDFICIVCNLTESTRNIIGDEQFRQGPKYFLTLLMVQWVDMEAEKSRTERMTEPLSH